jgi:diguanylate cyclase (GGDEF)-like protein
LTAVLTPPADTDAPAAAEEAISHLAALTAQRDRELMDVSLAQGVLELLGVPMVGVYRLAGRDDEAQHWLCSGLAQKGALTVSDPPWVDLDKLPLLDAHPLRRSVLDTRLMAQTGPAPAAAGDAGVAGVAGEVGAGELPLDAQGVGASIAPKPPAARYLTVLPLLVEAGEPGVLELWSEQPLSLPLLRPIQTLLKVFGNFQNLLESSQRDALTGLLNRQTFDATFLKASMPVVPDATQVMPGERRAQPVTGYWLGVIDIDLFKLVNDGFGHLIGDEVLVLVARIMRQTFRHYDRLYRFGGEEFVVLLRGGTESDAQRAFDRFRRNVEAYPFPQVKRVTVSVGLTEVQHKDTPSVAFSRADQGVYQAKHQGRNQVLCFEALVRSGALHDGDTHVGDVELF